MNKEKSTAQQINTELAIRGANKRVKKVIEKHTPHEEHPNLKIDFYCECSNYNCKERISLTLEEFEELHDDQATFVIAKGHSSPDVETVLKTRHNLQVVQKPALN